MPVPSQLTRAEFADLLELLVTDPLGKQNTARRLRDAFYALRESVFFLAEDQLGTGGGPPVVGYTLPGPNLRKDGFKSVRFLTTADPRYVNDGSDSALDQLDTLLCPAGCVVFVDFGAAGTGPELYRLRFDNTPRTPAGSGLRGWRDGRMAPPCPTIPVRWVLEDSADALKARFRPITATQLTPAFTAPVVGPPAVRGEVGTFTPAGFAEGFYEYLGGTPYAVPKAPGATPTDTVWKQVAAPVPVEALSQNLDYALAEAEAAAGRLVRHRLYRLIGGDFSTQRSVLVTAAAADRFSPVALRVVPPVGNAPETYEAGTYNVNTGVFAIGLTAAQKAAIPNDAAETNQLLTARTLAASRLVDVKSDPGRRTTRIPLIGYYKIAAPGFTVGENVDSATIQLLSDTGAAVSAILTNFTDTNAAIDTYFSTRTVNARFYLQYVTLPSNPALASHLLIPLFYAGAQNPPQSGQFLFVCEPELAGVFDTLAVLSYVAAGVVLDFNAATVQTLAATGNVTLTTANLAPLRTKEVYLTNTTAAAITVSYPAGWSAYPTTTNLAAGAKLLLRSRCLGTTDSTVEAQFVAGTAGTAGAPAPAPTVTNPTFTAA